jgi:transcriptional antiterminator RfaH
MPLLRIVNGRDQDGVCMDNNARTPWYLAQLKPNGLSLALRNLERQRVPTFAPTETRTLRRSGTFITKPAPVFPGYVFVQIDQERCSIRSINATRGISRLVSLGPEPSVVPKDVMAVLFARFAQENETTDAPAFQPGDMVDILEGPLAAFAARIEALAPNDRVTILLDIMGRSSRVTLSARQVRLAEH